MPVLRLECLNPIKNEVKAGVNPAESSRLLYGLGKTLLADLAKLGMDQVNDPASRGGDGITLISNRR